MRKHQWAGLIVALAISVAASPSLYAMSAGNDIVRAARQQVGKTLSYDSGYHQIAYPNGDVPISRGVCTDVVIRALRTSRQIDLQKLLHEDIRANFSKYPKNWGLKRPDRNIDHRRVPNLQTLFKRRGWSVGGNQSRTDFRAGDIVTCIVPQNLPHVMIVSDKVGASGNPMIIHNIGAGAKEEDRLFEFRITGHFRVP